MESRVPASRDTSSPSPSEDDFCRALAAKLGGFFVEIRRSGDVDAGHD